MSEREVILYPRSERNKEQKAHREMVRQEHLRARRYHVKYEVNRGHGTERFTGYYRSEYSARLWAFFLTLGSKANLTKVTLIKRY